MVVEYQEKVLREFPQINAETGVSGDYNSEFQSFSSGAMDADWWHMGTLEDFKKWHAEGKTKIVSRYEERYPPSVYDYGKITDEAVKKRIERLNEIADEINALFLNEQYNREEFYRLFVEAFGIIYGDNHKRYLEYVKKMEEEFGKKERKE